MTHTRRTTSRNLVLSAIAGASLTLPSITCAFNEEKHAEVTRLALNTVAYESGPRLLQFSEGGLDDVIRANLEMDSIPKRNVALLHPERHFTNDRFFDTSARILRLKTRIIGGMMSGTMSGEQARKELGWALHAIQDFYAHSTWLDTGRSTTLDGLGHQTYRDPLPGEYSCEYDEEVVSPNPSLTSAYFKEVSGCFLVPSGKCLHGNYTRSCLGINKDLDEEDALEEGVPMHPLHPLASLLAQSASHKFVSGILSSFGGNELAARRLLATDIGFAVVVDDSGSMGDTIAGVSAAVSQMVSSSTPDSGPEQFVFLRFGDPFVGSPVVLNKGVDLVSAINSISPDGGGDCAEMSQSAILAAVAAAPEDSRVFLFTDATAKDSHLGNLVVAAAAEKSIDLNYALTGSCSPIDPAYIRGAHETGGLLIRAKPSELVLLAPLFQSLADGDMQTILRKRLVLADGLDQEISIPVDTSVRELFIVLAIESNDGLARVDVELAAPDEGLRPVDGSNLVEVEGMKLVRIRGPRPGAWRARLSGAGRVSVQARGASKIAFMKLQAVEPNTDIHGGFERLDRTTTIGEEAVLEATIGTEIRTPEFSLVDESGDVFGSLLMTRDMPGGDAELFYSALLLPPKAFRMRVSGVDSSGNTVLRESSALVRPQLLSVSSSDPYVEVKPGVRKVIEVHFKNNGPQATYSVNVTDPAGYAQSVSPTVLMLPPGTEGVVQVAYQAPPGAAEGDSSRATVRFTNHDVSTAYSQINQNVFVVSGQPAACLPPKSQASLWPPNGKMREAPVGDYLNSIGIDVGQQQAYKVLRVTQDELRTNPAGPDATGVGTPVLGLRVERRGDGNGRVYRVEYEAQGEGGKCVGWFNVGVPHSASAPAVDDGQIHASAP